MEYALIQVLPDIPPGQVFAGIDWAHHVARVIDMSGRVKDRFPAVHDKPGIEALIARLRRAGVSEVAIERGDGVTALYTGKLPASGGERRILQLAASIAAGTPSPCTTPSPASTTRT